ncbi:MAG: hypothetical protein V3S73_07965 [Gammaproteobacteria bacterium]
MTSMVALGLAANVTGNSRLMRWNEAGALAALECPHKKYPAPPRTEAALPIDWRWRARGV